jgi:hypothetical protein
MEESETRRDVDRAAAGIARDEGRKRSITPAQRARMIRQMKMGIEPTLKDVDPQLRQEATKATEKERDIRDQTDEQVQTEAAIKQREANLKRTEAAKDTKTKVPKLSDVAEKRPATKRRTKLKSLPEDVVKEANKRIDQGQPGSVNEIITKVKEDLGIPRFENGVDTPLPDSVVKELKQGNLKEALELLSKTEVNPTIKRLAKQFSTMVGTTKVAIVPANPEDISGKDNYYELKNKKTAIAYRQVLNTVEKKNNTRVPGMYQPISDEKTLARFNDIILLDETTGLTPATLMHEMAPITPTY